MSEWVNFLAYGGYQGFRHGGIFGAAEQHDGARGQALAQLHQLIKGQALGGVLRADGHGHVAVLERRGQGGEVYFLACGNEVVEAPAVVFHAQRGGGRQVALHDVHARQLVNFEVDQQPLLPVQLVEAAGFHAQPQLDEAGAQVVVQVDDVVELLGFQLLLPGRSGCRSGSALW